MYTSHGTNDKAKSETRVDLVIDRSSDRRTRNHEDHDSWLIHIGELALYARISEDEEFKQLHCLLTTNTFFSRTFSKYSWKVRQAEAMAFSHGATVYPNRLTASIKEILRSAPFH